MMRYLSRRVIVGLVSLVVFTFVMFWLVESLIPGDFFTPFRLGMTQQEVDALRASYGVDRPLPVRWWRWLIGLAEGGLGVSTFGGGVSRQLGQVIAPTVFVFFVGLLLAYAIGQWLGRVTGWRRSAVSDGLTFAGIGVSSLFPPFLGFVVTTFLAIRLRRARTDILGLSSREIWGDFPLTENQVLVRMTIAVAGAALLAGLLAWVVWRRRRRRVPSSVLVGLTAGLSVIAMAQTDMLPQAADVFFEALLPLVAFTALAFGEFMLIMQTGMVGVMHDDFVMTARAKGLSERAVRDRHVARNASLAVVSRLAVSIPYLLTGLVIIERAVGWPGIGSFLFRAIESQDIPVVISTLAVVGLMTLVVRIGLDLALYALDARISRPVAS